MMIAFIAFVIGIVVGGVIGYAVGYDTASLRPIVREYKDETARLAKLRQADRTPVGG